MHVDKEDQCLETNHRNAVLTMPKYDLFHTGSQDLDKCRFGYH